MNYLSYPIFNGERKSNQQSTILLKLLTYFRNEFNNSLYNIKKASGTTNKGLIDYICLEQKDWFVDKIGFS